MSAITEDQRRIAQTKQALRRLATGDALKRGELFAKREGGKYESWIGKVLTRLVELGVIEAHGGNGFARYYQLAPATKKSELIAQANDDEKVSTLLWPSQEIPEPEPEPDESDESDEPEPTTDEAALLTLRLMGGVIEKLDRIERTQLECLKVFKESLEILREFK